MKLSRPTSATLGNIYQALARLVDELETTEPWRTPTFLNSWVNFGSGQITAAYFKDALGFVHLRGLIKSGTLNTEAFVLPEGYRPVDGTLMFGTVADNGSTVIGRLDVGIDGKVVPVSGGNVFFSLNGISFRPA